MKEIRSIINAWKKPKNTNTIFCLKILEPLAGALPGFVIFPKMSSLLRIVLLVAVSFGILGSGCAALERYIVNSVTVKGQALEGYKKPRTTQEVADFLLWIYDEYVRLWEYEEFGWRKTKREGVLSVKIRRTWSWETPGRCKKIIKTLGFGLKEVRQKEILRSFPGVFLQINRTGESLRLECYDLTAFFDEGAFRRMVFERIPVYRLRIDCLSEDGTVLVSKYIPLSVCENKAVRLNPSSCSIHFNHIREGELEFLPYGHDGKWVHEIFPLEIELPEGVTYDSVESIRCSVVKTSSPE